jgi:type I restriction enzyme S subunit
MKEGWEIKTLGEVCIVERGSSPRPIEKYQTSSPDGVNWIKIGDTKGIEKYIYTTKEKITKEGAEKSRHVKEGDFILSNSMSFGKPYIMKTDGYIHDGWFVFRIPNFLDKDYFYYLVSSPTVQDQIQSLGAGSIVKNISGDLVKKVTLRYPSKLSEQQRIVSIIDEAFEAIDKAIENTQKNLQNAKELFESYLNNVFENGGEGWEIKRLGDVLEKTETVDPAKKPNKEFMYLDVSSVNKVTKQIENVAVLLGKDAPSRARKLVRTNDVIFATVRPTHSRVALIPEEYDEQVCSTGYFVLRAKDFLSNNFIFFFLLTSGFNSEMEKLQKGASYPAVTDTEVKSILIPFPSLKAQQTIVQELDALKLESKNLEAKYQQKLTNLEELKKSILNKAFAGEL